MTDFQLIVMTRPAADGVHAFASQAEGMLTPPPMKGGRITGATAADALLEGVLAGLDDIKPRVFEGDRLVLRLAGSAQGASAAKTVMVKKAMHALRLRGIDILTEEADTLDLSADLARRMADRLDMGAMVRM